MVVVLPWLCSALTIAAQVAVGKSKWQGWVLYMMSAMAFTVYALVISSWGLMPLNAVSFVVATRNAVAWRKKAAFDSTPWGWS